MDLSPLRATGSLRAIGRQLISVLGLLVSLQVRVRGQAVIVDIDSVRNGRQNPVVVSLEPGAYDVTVIRPKDGGNYDGYLLSFSNPTSYTYGYAFSADRLPEKVLWDKQIYPTREQAFAHAISTRLMISTRSDVRFYTMDEALGDNVGGVSLQVARDDTLPALNFGSLSKESCSGSTLRYTIAAELSTGRSSCDRAGPSGWSIAVAAQGCKIVAATTTGTAADLVPMGQRLDGFEHTEVIDTVGNEGAVSVVTLSVDGMTTLPACSTSDVLKLTLEAPAPRSSDCAAATLRYVDRTGSTGKISNQITVAGKETTPFLQAVDLDLCKCFAGVSFRPTGPGSVQVLIEHETPIVGGELGVSFDPSRMVPVKVIPGPDFLGEAEDILTNLNAPVSCSGGNLQEAVEAGLTIAWINAGTGASLEGGVHALLELQFAVADGEAGGLCSPLQFVSCLGRPEAPVRNIVTDLQNKPILLKTHDGRVCSGEAAFQRGDVNGDGQFDISDAIGNLRCLFLGESCTSCRDATDTNDDGQVDVSDTIYLLRWRFLDGTPPPLPFGRCGIDRTPDALGICSYPLCEQ